VAPDQARASWEHLLQWAPHRYSGAMPLEYATAPSHPRLRHVVAAARAASEVLAAYANLEWTHTGDAARWLAETRIPIFVSSFFPPATAELLLRSLPTMGFSALGAPPGVAMSPPATHVSGPPAGGAVPSMRGDSGWVGMAVEQPPPPPRGLPGGGHYGLPPPPPPSAPRPGESDTVPMCGPSWTNPPGTPVTILRRPHDPPPSSAASFAFVTDEADLGGGGSVMGRTPGSAPPPPPGLAIPAPSPPPGPEFTHEDALGTIVHRLFERNRVIYPHSSPDSLLALATDEAKEIRAKHASRGVATRAPPKPSHFHTMFPLREGDTVSRTLADI